jgi:hypothetical protein
MPLPAKIYARHYGRDRQRISCFIQCRVRRTFNVPRRAMLLDSINLKRGFPWFSVTALFLCVFLSPLALAQVSTDQFQSGLAAPPDRSVQLNSDILKKKPSRFEHSNAAKNIKGRLTSGAAPKEASPLCFQPGVGWQRTPIVTGRPTDVSQKAGNECSSSLALGAAVEASKAGALVQTSSSPGRTVKPTIGVTDAAPANPGTLFHPPAVRDPSESAQELATHAYISPIKLRRMMRNAPDLETRLAVRKLSAKPTTTPARNSNQKSRAERKPIGTLGSASTSVSSLEAQRRGDRRPMNGSKDIHSHKLR